MGALFRDIPGAGRPPDRVIFIHWAIARFADVVLKAIPNDFYKHGWRDRVAQEANNKKKRIGTLRRIDELLSVVRGESRVNHNHLRRRYRPLRGHKVRCIMT